MTHSNVNKVNDDYNEKFRRWMQSYKDLQAYKAEVQPRIIKFETDINEKVENNKVEVESLIESLDS